MVENAFQRLKTGERVLLGSTRDIGPVFSRLQQRYGQRFDWLPLLVTDEQYLGYFESRLETDLTISGCLQRQHYCCKTIFLDVMKHFQQGEEAAGTELIRVFVWNAEPCFSGLEQVVFSVFRDRTGTLFGPTEIMVDEHQRIRKMLCELVAQAGSGKNPAMIEQGKEVSGLIDRHCQKEKQILYSLFDNYLADIAQETVRTLQLYMCV